MPSLSSDAKAGEKGPAELFWDALPRWGIRTALVPVQTETAGLGLAWPAAQPELQRGKPNAHEHGSLVRDGALLAWARCSSM